MTVARLGNVAGVVLPTAEAAPEAVQAGRDLLEALFVEVQVADAPGNGNAPLACLAAALARIEAERVVIVASSFALAPRLLLGLTAFPEDDLVVPAADAFTWGIARREAALAAASRCLAAGKGELSDLLGELSVSSLEGGDLSALAPARS